MNTAKPKLSIDEQVTFLKDTKGLLFNITSEKEAVEFLNSRNYFFKLKSYCKNYDKNKAGQYINLEFAYLQELSKLDMYLRRFILKLTIDIEHILKTKLIKDFSSNTACDGYKIVQDFFIQYPKIKDEIANYHSKGYTAKDNILGKYKTDLALWNIIEIIEFGKFIKLCDFYYDKYPDKDYKKI